MTTVRWPGFVCIVGIDGSGKSTVSKEFVKSAASHGITYDYAWVNNQPIFLGLLRFFARPFLLKRKTMFGDYQEYNKAKKSLAKKPLVLGVYRSIHALDYNLWVLLKVRLPLLVRRRLVCDRYLFDVVINLGLLMDLSFEQICQMMRQYLWRLPNPDLVFCIDVPAEVALSRKDDIPSIEYLEERKGLYLAIAKEFGFYVLDGRRPVSSIVEDIIETIQGNKKAR